MTIQDVRKQYGSKVVHNNGTFHLAMIDKGYVVATCNHDGDILDTDSTFTCENCNGVWNEWLGNYENCDDDQLLTIEQIKELDREGMVF